MLEIQYGSVLLHLQMALKHHILELHISEPVKNNNFFRGQIMILQTVEYEMGICK